MLDLFSRGLVAADGWSGRDVRSESVKPLQVERKLTLRAIQSRDGSATPRVADDDGLEVGEFVTGQGLSETYSGGRVDDPDAVMQQDLAPISAVI